MQRVKGDKEEWQWEREFTVDIAIVLIVFAYAYFYRKRGFVSSISGKTIRLGKNSKTLINEYRMNLRNSQIKGT